MVGFIALGMESTLPIPQLIRFVTWTVIHGFISLLRHCPAITNRNRSMASALPH